MTKLPSESDALLEVLAVFHRLNQDEYAAIGAVAVASAWIENDVEHLILRLAKLTAADGSVFLRGAMLDAKVNILEGLVVNRLRPPKKKAEFKALIAKLKHDNSLRVLAIHGLWANWTTFTAADAAAGRLGIDRAEVAALKKEQRLGIEKVKLLAEEMNKTHAELQRFVMSALPAFFRLRSRRSKAKKSTA